MFRLRPYRRDLDQKGHVCVVHTFNVGRRTPNEFNETRGSN